MKQETGSILFITLSCVGDAIMTTPVLESLHRRFPGAIIDVIADKRSSILFRHCPYLGDVFLKDKKKFLRGSVELLKTVGNRNYDLIVDLRTDGLAYFFRGKKRLTKWNKKPYGEHEVQQLMGVIHNLHGEEPIPATRLWLTEAERSFADSLLSTLPGNRWLAFAPGVAVEKKAWPVDKYVALANSLGDLFSGIILEGSPQERAVTTAVSTGLTGPFVNLAGKTDLLQAGAVLSRAALFVGSDSGLGHVASAVSTPTLTLFSVDSPVRVLPWGNRAGCLCAVNGDAGSISVDEVEHEVRKMFQSMPEFSQRAVQDTP